MTGLPWEQCRLKLGDAGVVIRVENLIKRCRRSGRKFVRGQIRYEPWCAPDLRLVLSHTARTLAPVVKGKNFEFATLAKKASIASAPAERTDLSVSDKSVRSEKASSNQVVHAVSGPGNYAAGESEQVIPVINKPGLPGTQEVPEVPAARVDKLEKSVPVVDVPGPTAAQVPEPAQPAEGTTKDVIASVAAQAIQASLVPANAPVVLTKEERDARRRALIAGAPAAQAKLDAEKAAQEKVAREIQENEARMDRIGKEIALEGINRLALPRRHVPEKE